MDCANKAVAGDPIELARKGFELGAAAGRCAWLEIRQRCPVFKQRCPGSSLPPRGQAARQGLLGLIRPLSISLILSGSLVGGWQAVPLHR